MLDFEYTEITEGDRVSGIVDISSVGENVPGLAGAGGSEKFPPTAEQQAAIDAFLAGKDLVVEAGAGCGKTTVLKMLADAAPEQRILYAAFNRVTADEAGASFASHVTCSTLHSLAYRAVGHQFRDRLNAPRVPPWTVAKLLGVYGPLYLGEVSLPPMAIASHVADTVRRFCMSADEEIHAKHVARVPGAEEYGGKLQQYIVPLARKMWADVSDPRGRKFNHSHDAYAKLHALSKPTLPYSTIFVDEAQDTTDMVAALIEAQDCQKVWVGDSAQALYGFRGARDQMSRVKVDTRLPLSQSFRFGQAVADEANRWLALLGSPLRLKGFEQIESSLGTVEEPDAILCRTNASVILEAISAREDGKSYALASGSDEIEKFVTAADKLKNGKRVLHPELSAFEDWDQVQEYSRTSDGRHIGTMVRLIDEHGIDAIRGVAREAVPESVADVTISTSHRAKGREWNKVRVGNDFEAQVNEDGEITRESCMLNYVTVTRAQHVLDRGGLFFIDQLENLGGTTESRA